MWDLLIPPLLLAGWFALFRWVLPWLGVPTCLGGGCGLKPEEGRGIVVEQAASAAESRPYRGGEGEDMFGILQRGTMAILMAAGVTTSSSAQESESLEQVKTRVEARGAYLVDVREQREWDRGHLRSAVLVPLSSLMDWDQNGISAADRAALIKALPKGSIVYCHCAAGGRAIPASETLRKLGYDARPLREGFSQLVAAGFPRAAK